MNKKELLELKYTQLLTHPRNMRRFYPIDQVKEMANSILAANGVIQPLVVTKLPTLDKDKFFVIDGNMRLTAAKTLGDKCPALNCRYVDQKEADQMLSMIIANQIRYDVDPVSEALHYKALRDEGLSIRDISKRTGIYESRITNRIILAELEEEIQELIAHDKLPHDPRIAKSLLQLTPSVRIKFAKRISENPNIKVKTVLAACERLMEVDVPTKKLKRPAAELSGSLKSKGATDPHSLRQAAKRMCDKCNQVEDRLRDGSEPAWSMIVHEADKNCNDCDLKEMQNICRMCPAVSLLRNLISIKENSDG